MAAYRFVTIWRFSEPIGQVWKALNAAEDYPLWWPNVSYYQCLTPENPRGVGACGKRAVRGFLPYSLHYTTTITRSEPPHDLAYNAEGDLVGDGQFVLKEITPNTPPGSAAGKTAGTEVTLHWNVATQGRWLNRLSPLLKWLFAANHNYVMRRGERGLADWLQRNP
ncbi:MAG TPA: hypothetical protein VFE46_16165 [Pirellulales bacterium]|jgi:uncharacterized protein YndB with AHSA1/START domain|nr:hypothetical protein [Pirellulales bacterium]